MSKELIIKAKELGIENAEVLTAAQLKIAIAAAQEKSDISTALKAKAEGFGITTDGLSDDELSVAITEAEAITAEIQKQARDTEMLAFLSEYLGITDISILSQEEVKVLLDERLAKEAAGIEVVLVQEGKTEKSLKASNGKEYVFADDAPAAFRYLGQHKTQEEWIADSDAVELMIAGNLSFLTLKK